jgi:hypothetical protein
MAIDSAATRGVCRDDGSRLAFAWVRKRTGEEGRRQGGEGDMKSLNWNAVIQSLVLVRLGQELGTDSRLARAVHDLFDAMLAMIR